MSERESRNSSRQGPKPDSRVAELAAEDWGVLSTDDLARCGLSEKAIKVRSANGRLHRLHQGVYAVGHRNVTLEGRLLAAVKACGDGAVLSHRSAAVLWGFFEWEERWPDVTVPAGTTREHEGINTHRSALLGPTEVTRHRGIPVTSPARTLLDLAAILPPRALRAAVRRAQSLQRVNVRQLAEALQRHRGRRGTRALAKAIASGPAPTRSELEDVVLDLLLGGGLQLPDVNVPLILDGRRVVPDFRWPAQRLIVEADGRAWHDNRTAREDDAERQALLERHGERVLRVTWKQALTRPAETLGRIRAAGAPAARLSAPSGRSAAR